MVNVEKLLQPLSLRWLKASQLAGELPVEDDPHLGLRTSKLANSGRRLAVSARASNFSPRRQSSALSTPKCFLILRVTRHCVATSFRTSCRPLYPLNHQEVTTFKKKQEVRYVLRLTLKSRAVTGIYRPASSSNVTADPDGAHPPRQSLWTKPTTCCSTLDNLCSNVRETHSTTVF